MSYGTQWTSVQVILMNPPKEKISNPADLENTCLSIIFFLSKKNSALAKKSVISIYKPLTISRSSYPGFCFSVLTTHLDNLSWHRASQTVKVCRNRDIRTCVHNYLIKKAVQNMLGFLKPSHRRNLVKSRC